MAEYLFRCPNCGHTNDVHHGLAELEGSYFCSACGLSAQESTVKIQEDLAKMFNQSMSFTHQPQVNQQPSVDQPRQPMNFSISQHYHHSAHLVPQTPTDRQGQDTNPMNNSTGSLSMIPARINLAERADSARSRALELEGAPYEHDLQDASLGSRSTDMGLGEDMGHAGQDRAAAERAAELQGQHAEPYMKSGYETLAEREYSQQEYGQAEPTTMHSHFGSALGNRPAFDPAHNSKEWWRHGESLQPIEHQYGMFEQASWGRDLNQPGLHEKQDTEMS